MDMAIISVNPLNLTQNLCGSECSHGMDIYHWISVLHTRLGCHHWIEHWIPSYANYVWLCWAPGRHCPYGDVNFRMLVLRICIRYGMYILKRMMRYTPYMVLSLSDTKYKFSKRRTRAWFMHFQEMVPFQEASIGTEFTKVLRYRIKCCVEFLLRFSLTRDVVWIISLDTHQRCVVFGHCSFPVRPPIPGERNRVLRYYLCSNHWFIPLVRYSNSL